MLTKLYRRILAGEYYIYKTPSLSVSEVEDFRKTKSAILMQTKKEFYLSSKISLLNKLGFMLLNRFPGLLHSYLDSVSLW